MRGNVANRQGLKMHIVQYDRHYSEALVALLIHYPHVGLATARLDLSFSLSAKAKQDETRQDETRLSFTSKQSSLWRSYTESHASLSCGPA